MKKLLKNEEGSIIVITVIILMIISAIAFSLVFVILNSLKSLTVIMDASKAYYAAETGLERSLYEINDQRMSKGDLEDVALNIGDYEEDFDNNSEYEINSISISEESITLSLDEMQTVEIGLFHPDDPLASIIINGGSLNIDWTEADDCPVGTSRVEVSTGFWQENLWEDEPADDNKFISNCCTHDSPLTAGFIYRIRARSLTCDLEEVTIAATDDGVPVDIYGQIALTSVGTAGKSNQALQAQTVWQAPLFSIYDFALFSECDIRKDNDPILCP